MRKSVRTFFKALVILLLKLAVTLAKDHFEPIRMSKLQACAKKLKLTVILVGDVVMTHIIKGYVSCCRLTITPGYVK